MSFNTRDEYINAAASEKVTLVHINANVRLINFTVFSGTVYELSVPYYVNELKTTTGSLTKVASLGAVVPGTFYYKPDNSTVYVELSDSSDPALSEMIAKVVLFYGSSSVTTSNDLTDTGVDVYYDGRVSKTPGFKYKVGVDQGLVSTVGTGSIELQNNDGELDEFYDKLIFENQEVLIYSWNRELPASESRLIFRGLITDTKYDSERVVYQVKDKFYELNQNIPQPLFTEADNVNTNILGRYKRWVYGRVDGLQLQSTDQIGEGFGLAGTITSTTPIKQRVNLSFANTGPAAYNGGHVLIHREDNNPQHYIWWDYNNTGTDPEIAGFTGLEVNLSVGDTFEEIVTKTKNRIDSVYDIIGFDEDVPGSFLQVENKKIGEATDPSNVGSQVTPSVVNQGASDKVLVGTSTSFLTDLSPGDTLFVETQEFTVENIRDDNNIVVSDEPAFTFVDRPMILKPIGGTTLKNREHFVAAHACAKLTKTVVLSKQFNRIELNDTNGLVSGDFIEFSSGERVEIKNVAPGNIVVLRKNLINLPVVGTSATRQPIQQVYIKDQLANADDYTVSSVNGETAITLDADIEFNISRQRSFGVNMTFTNGSRVVTNNSTTPLTDTFKSNDYIRSADVLYSTYYKILEVTDAEITIRTVFSEPTVTDEIEAKIPDYIIDDTIISSNVLGKTVDGEPEGEWLQTSSDVVKDLLLEGGFTGQINDASFVDVDARTRQLVSVAFPLNASNSEGTTLKTAIDTINASTQCALTIDNDLKLQYVSVIVQTSVGSITISDNDVVKWSIQGKGSKAANSASYRYRHKDIDRFTQESGNSAINVTSPFVNNYIGIERTLDLDVYLYETADANIAAERGLYYNTLKRSEIKIESDLRLEAVQIGDTIIMDFGRLYKRMGDSSTRKKLGTVVGRIVTGDRMVLEVSDYGNTYNSSAFITDNSALDFATADADEKLLNGYITDNEGIVENDADTNKINLIG